MVVKESFGDSVRPYPPIGGDGTQASGVEFVVALYPALRTGLFIVVLLRRTFLHCIQSREGLNNK